MVLQYPDADKHFMLANLDYSVVGSDEVQILECKTAGEYGAKLWRDGVPLSLYWRYELPQLTTEVLEAKVFQRIIDREVLSVAKRLKSDLNQIFKSARKKKLFP